MKQINNSDWIIKHFRQELCHPLESQKKKLGDSFSVFLFRGAEQQQDTTQCDYRERGANGLLVQLACCSVPLALDGVSSFLAPVPPTVLLASVSLRKTLSISRKLVVGSCRGEPPRDTLFLEYSALFYWVGGCSIYAKSQVTGEGGR